MTEIPGNDNITPARYGGGNMLTINKALLFKDI
jgi:hypothetical protein